MVTGTGDFPGITMRVGDTVTFKGPSIPNFNIAPLFFKMAENLDLRCVLVPAPWVLGPKHVSNPE